MARLEAQSKLLYYPTPDGIARQIGTNFSAPTNIRIADPCAGTGQALLELITGIGIERRQAETWGIELSYSRAQKAAQSLDKVLPASFYRVRWDSKSVGLIFNNPPYDWSEFIDIKTGKHIRHEILFIEQATPRLVPGGHQVIIVPHWIVGQERVARHLLGYYEHVSLARFPDGEYERFKQIVIFACNKREKYIPPAGVADLIALGDEANQLGILTEGIGEFIIPPTPGTTCTFTYRPIDPKDQILAAERVAITRTDTYTKATYVPPLGAPFSPAMPLSVGHVTMLLSSQQAGVLRIEDEDGQPFLLKGMSTKEVDRSQESVDDDTDGINERERFVSTMAIIDSQGQHKLLTRSDEIGELVKKYANQLADAVLDKNFPIYNNNPTPREWKITSRVAFGLPPLPGRKERGLFPLQRAMAIAAPRAMRKHGSAIINAEPGFGKTATSTGALMVLDEWPAVVVGPGHMVWKWARELQTASDPKDPIQARVITRPARPVPRLKFDKGKSLLFEPGYEPGKISELFNQAMQDEYWWPKVRHRLEEAGAEIIATERWQVEAVFDTDCGMRRSVQLKAASAANLARIIKVLESLALRHKKQIVQPEVKVNGLEVTAILPDRDDYSTADFNADYLAGRLGKKAVAVIGFEANKYDAGDDPSAAMPVRSYRDEHGRIKKVSVCPRCGTPFSKRDRYCQAELQIPVRDQAGSLVTNEEGELRMESRPCGSALFQFSRWRRIGLARLVQHKYRNFFKVYIVDEVHKAKSGDTDLGVSDQRLISSTRYNLALTGTLFGGNASSLFHLLYRRSMNVRRLYSHDQVRLWIDHYGRWERDWKQNKPKISGYGASTGVKRWSYRERELPGVSPAVIRFLLPMTLFGNIADLGYQLPPIHEHVEMLDMPTALSGQMADLDTTLLTEALSRLTEKGDPSLIPLWFTNMRFRPSSAFRDEVVRGDDFEMELEAVTEPGDENGLRWLPKERRLAEIVAHNIKIGRKTLVYVEQTGTRDIRKRLYHAIEQLCPEKSPRIESLSAGDMKPASRERWIKQNAKNIDVLLVNPRIVETGLDLIEFSHLVFFETSISLYTLWQSLCRVWRLGQDKDVYVTFLAYSGSTEEQILARMGEKKKAAQMLYGKEAAGVLVEVDDNDIQREMIRAALEGNPRIKVDLSAGLFTDGDRTKSVMVDDSPMGSLVATSPQLPTTTTENEDWFQASLFGDSVPVSGSKRH